MSNKQDSPKWASMNTEENNMFGTCRTSNLTYDTLVWTYNYYMIICANQWLMFHFIRSNGIIYSLSLIKDKTISQRCTTWKIISWRLPELSILSVLSHTHTHINSAQHKLQINIQNELQSQTVQITWISVVFSSPNKKQQPHMIYQASLTDIFNYTLCYRISS